MRSCSYKFLIRIPLAVDRSIATATVRSQGTSHSSTTLCSYFYFYFRCLFFFYLRRCKCATRTKANSFHHQGVVASLDRPCKKFEVFNLGNSQTVTLNEFIA